MLGQLKANQWLLSGTLASFIWGGQYLLSPFFVSAHLGGPLAGAFAQPVQAAELDAIKARGYMIVAVKDNRVPLGFTDESGNLRGFEIEIARRLARTLLGDADAVEFLPVTNVDRLNAVLEGRADIAIAGITLTAARRRLVHFSDPYYLDGTAFVTRPTSPPLPNIQPSESELSETQTTGSQVSQGQPIQALSDLRSEAIAVLNRASSVAHVRYLLPGAQLVGVESYEAGQQLLARGEVAAFAGDASVLTGWVREEGALAGYQLLPNVISADPLAIAMPKGVQHRDLQIAVNQAIRQWYTEEWLQTEATEWGLPSGILPSLAPEGSPETSAP